MKEQESLPIPLLTISVVVSYTAVTKYPKLADLKQYRLDYFTVLKARNPVSVLMG